MKEISAIFIVFVLNLICGQPALSDGGVAGGCLNRFEGHGKKFDLNKWDKLIAVSDFNTFLESGHYVIYNSRGRHMTWILIVDSSRNPHVAYETYDASSPDLNLFG